MSWQGYSNLLFCYMLTVFMGKVNWAQRWRRPLSWENRGGRGRGREQRMTTMRKFPGHVCCVGRLLVHIPPPRGSWEQMSEGGEAELVHPLFRGLTAAAQPGLGAAVTSHPRDILKGATQQGDEFWVGRCRGLASALLIHPHKEDITLI